MGSFCNGLYELFPAVPDQCYSSEDIFQITPPNMG